MHALIESADKGIRFEYQINKDSVIYKCRFFKNDKTYIHTPAPKNHEEMHISTIPIPPSCSYDEIINKMPLATNTNPMLRRHGLRK